MKYISTRGGGGAEMGFTDALLTGLARDGGLIMPEAVPQLSKAEWAALKGKPYQTIATEILCRFTGTEMPKDEMAAMVAATYADFSHTAIAPVVAVGDAIHLLELFHGPTIAFKDYAMQFLARAFDWALQAQGKRAVILGATSGDTGSAALEAFKGRDFVDVFILFPKGRVSPIQQKQMTSVLADGVFAVEAHGDFDACQNIVKALFGDLAFRDRLALSAVNSINWARLMPQIVYYATSALAHGAPEKPVAFAVPTGNFGNIFAGFIARKMGLPIEALICASNRNDILTRFFETGVMHRQTVQPSLSPSMDIQVSSNFERLLFELLDRDAEKLADLMHGFAKTGAFQVDDTVLAKARTVFFPWRLDDAGILAEIKATYDATGLIIDPHTAVGLSAARAARRENIVSNTTPIIALACAHPAKFPDAVRDAIGITPNLPHHLSDLMERPHRHLTASATPDSIMQVIEANRRF